MKIERLHLKPIDPIAECHKETLIRNLAAELKSSEDVVRELIKSHTEQESQEDFQISTSENFTLLNTVDAGVKLIDWRTPEDGEEDTDVKLSTLFEGGDEEVIALVGDSFNKFRVISQDYGSEDEHYNCLWQRSYDLEKDTEAPSEHPRSIDNPSPAMKVLKTDSGEIGIIDTTGQLMYLDFYAKEKENDTIKVEKANFCFDAYCSWTPDPEIPEDDDAIEQFLTFKKLAAAQNDVCVETYRGHLHQDQLRIEKKKDWIDAMVAQLKFPQFWCFEIGGKWIFTHGLSIYVKDRFDGDWY